MSTITPRARKPAPAPATDAAAEAVINRGGSPASTGPEAAVKAVAKFTLRLPRARLTEIERNIEDRTGGAGGSVNTWILEAIQMRLRAGQ